MPAQSCENKCVREIGVQQRSLLVTRQEAADLLQCSVRFVDYLLARRDLPIRRLGRRVLIPRAALERFAELDGQDGVRSHSEALCLPAEEAR
jgi:excisionase family DNA binding protein